MAPSAKGRRQRSGSSSSANSESSSSSSGGGGEEAPKQKQRTQKEQPASKKQKKEEAYFPPPLEIAPVANAGIQNALQNPKRIIVLLDQARMETVKTRKGEFELMNCDDHRGMLYKPVELLGFRPFSCCINF
jgi:hypothetical protein